MTDRRSFIKSGLAAGTAALFPPLATRGNSLPAKSFRRHWVWTNPDLSDTEDMLVKRYRAWYGAGIRGVFFEAGSPLHYRVAKSQRLEAHRWMWAMNRGEKALLNAHPEWYAINRKGESCADKPPYVDYYRWLCPSRPEVLEYLVNDVRRILSNDHTDGIHLDYVRFCDVILPVNLWDHYQLEQTRELPEYDYCYCHVCREKFRQWRGKDISEIEYPDASLSWRLFRYNAITAIVNELSRVATGYKKQITAAVFPTPEVARRNVRQDWTNWDLTGICPMIYHGFYKENVAWIGDAVAEGVHWLNGKFPLYAGLFIPDFKDNDASLQEGIETSLRNGAAGVSLFGNVTDNVLDALLKASAAVKP